MSQLPVAASAASSSACVGLDVVGVLTVPTSAPITTGVAGAALDGAAAVCASESTITRPIGERIVSFCVPTGMPLRDRMYATTFT
jgi:hypothetical protein